VVCANFRAESGNSRVRGRAPYTRARIASSSSRP